MSHHQRTIAKLDAFHTVALCNHNALHLNWGSLSVHIPRHNFQQLAQMLHQVTIGSARQQLSNPSCRLNQDSKGNFELRFPDLALYLSANDMLQLVLLVEEAVLALGEQDQFEALEYPTGPVLVEARPWSSGRYRPSMN
ncbi:MAG: hypothetical protein KIS80_09065 [Anaerolineales bacterium]|nr:hypothetical protein [Anaerolineales bacterium]MCW5855050.1 hypothetical protein [Anaerolineales bacterium]MCW5878998.1 hypothetical protein [Anaerolineales bacterium]